MQIKIGKVPGRTQVLELQEGATIADAVREANLDVTGHELRYNGASTENFNQTISDGAIVLLTPRIKGNMDNEYITVIFKNDEYSMKATDTVGKLLEVSDWEDYIDEDIEAVAIRTNEKWVAVRLSDKLINDRVYDVVDIDEVVMPARRETISTCSCGGNCNNTINVGDELAGSDKVTIIVGDLEITINKIR